MDKNDSAGGELRRWIKGTNSFKSYSDLETAKSDPNAYVVMEGDWGGQIYLTCPVKYVICDEDMLRKILKKIDHMCWKGNGGDGAEIYYETWSQGEDVPGGMGGGLATDGLWIHPKILEENDIAEELEVLILGANTPWIYTNVTRQEFEAVKDKVDARTLLATMKDLETIKNKFPGISCAYKDAAGTVKTKCFGFADKEGDVPVDENTAFPACSISKFITAICIMKEYEQGRIDINKPVNLYLRKWKLLTPAGDESDAPIRSLMSHTSGIIDGEDSFYGLRRSDKPVSLSDVLEGKTSYNKRPAREEKPHGTEFEYSDAGFCVLQMLLEDIVQKPFEVIAEEFVFAPLNLKNTFFASLTNLSCFEKKIAMATGYDENGKAIPDKYPQVPDLAASGLWSTPTDLLVIAREFTRACNGESALLQAKYALEMATPSDRFPWAGLGIFMDGENKLSISGWGENGQSRLKFNYRTGEAAAVMVNQNPGVEQSESGVEWLINNGFTIE